MSTEEPVPVRLKRRKQIIPCNFTPMCFFSHAGQKRLTKIWEEHNLSEELIFSGLIGPTDAFIREQVSDYLQSYLQYRSRRSSVTLKPYGNIDGKLSTERRQLYASFDELLRNDAAVKDKKRMQNEKERINNLIMHGQMEPIKGFKSIYNDPVYKANKLLASIKQLQKEEPANSFNFSQRDLAPISHQKNARQPRMTKTKSDSFLDISTKCEQPIIYCSTPKPRFSREESSSSGFQEITPSNLTHTQEHFGESEIEFPTPTMDHEMSVSSNISAADMLEYSKEVTGYLDFQMYFPWESPLVKEAAERNSVEQLYDASKNVLEVYRRQGIVGNEFIRDWNALLLKRHAEIL